MKRKRVKEPVQIGRYQDGLAMIYEVVQICPGIKKCYGDGIFFSILTPLSTYVGKESHEAPIGGCQCMQQKYSHVFVRQSK